MFAPFRTKQKELGLKLDLGSFAHTFSVYEIKRPSSYTDPITNIFSLGSEQRNRGVEWGFFGAPMDGVRLLGGVAYVQPACSQAADCGPFSPQTSLRRSLRPLANLRLAGGTGPAASA